MPNEDVPKNPFPIFQKVSPIKPVAAAISGWPLKTKPSGVDESKARPSPLSAVRLNDCLCIALTLPRQGEYEGFSRATSFEPIEPQEPNSKMPDADEVLSLSRISRPPNVSR